MKLVFLRTLCLSLATVALWVAGSGSLSAQTASSYLFAASSGTYTAITGTSLTTSTSTDYDEENFPVVTLPFTFSYAGSSFTTVGISANGYLRLGATTSTDYTPVDGFTYAISALGEDLYGPSATAGRNISYTTTGPVGSRVFTVQWTNWGFWSSGASDVNFQIKLLETTNEIQFVYGAMPMASATTQTPQVGISGATTSDYKVLATSTNWSAPTFATSGSTTMTLTSTVKPASGQTYTFTPPPNCVGVPTPGSITPASASLCPGSAITLTLAGNTNLGGNSVQWQSSADNITFTNISGATGTTYSNSSLSTTIYYRVRVNCSFTNDSAFSNTVTVTVAPPTTTTATLPYTQSFESWVSTCSTTDRPSTEWTTTPFNGNNAWRRNDQGASANWGGPTSGAYSPAFTAGSFSARFHAWNTSSIGSMMLYVNLSPAGSKLLTFDHINTSGSDSLYVELSTDGGATYSILAGYGVAATWTGRSIAMTSTAANAIIRFRAKGDFGSTDIGMDNLAINVVACLPPTGVMASSVTNTGATLNWTAPVVAPSAGYEYEVRSSGAAGSGPAGLAASGTATGVSATVGSLSANTLYSIYVRSNCGSSLSPWTAASNFTTACNAITVLPFTETFESTSTTKACWKVVDANNDGDQWNLSSTRVTGHGGTMEASLYTDFNSGANNDWLIMPAITLGTNKQLRYWYRAESSSEPNDYTVKISTTGSNPADFTTTLMPLTSVSNTTWLENTINLSAYTGTVYIAFHVPSGGLDGWYLHIDDVTVEAIPSCLPPTAVTAGTMTSTSGSFSWTAPSPAPASGYQYYVSTSSTAPIATTTPTGSVGAGVLTATAGSLTPNTTYYVWVRGNCGTTQSPWTSSALAFTTLCANATLPFAENFATYLPPCWTEAKGALSLTPSALTGTSSDWTSDGYLNVGSSGAAKMNIYDNSGPREWLISPSIDLGAATGNFVLEFNLGVLNWNTTTPGTLGSDDSVAVVISTNNGATWTRSNALRTWTASSTPLNTTTGGQRYFLPLYGYSGVVKIGWYASNGTVANTADIDVFVDSVRVSTCARPTVNLGNDTLLCGGGSLTLNGGTGTAFEFSNGATTQTTAITLPGTYSVTTYNGNPGCFSRDTIVVSAAPSPVVNLGSDTSFCAGGSRVLNAGNPGAAFLWSTNANTQTITANTGGQYSVRVTNALGCVGRDTVNITVNPLPVVNLGPDATVCGNVFSYILNAGNPGSTYAWSPGGSTAQALDIANAINQINNNPTSANPPALQYSVTVTSPNGCVGRDTINILPRLTPRFSDYTISGIDPTLTFTPRDDSFATSFLWNFGDGSTATTRTATHTFATPGIYPVSLRISNSCGADSMQKQVGVMIITTGISSVDAGDLKLYPNPATNYAVIETANGLKLRGVQVISASGAFVATVPADGNRATVNTANLASGIYTLRIQLDKGVVIRKLEVLK